MYKTEQEWLAAVQKDDLAATVEMLQTTRQPDVSPSPKLSQIRRELLNKNAARQPWLPLLGRGIGTLISLTLLVLLVGYFWINQGNQATSSPEEPEDVAGPVSDFEQEATAVMRTDQVWWLAIRRQLTDRNTNLTPYEIEVGYKLETVDTAVAQVFLAPKNWETVSELYPFSEPVTISAEDDNVTFTVAKELDQFFQEIPPRVNSLVIALSSPAAEANDMLIASTAWKNFVDTEYFAGPILIAPASDSALNVFDWEFDNNFFAVESPPGSFVVRKSWHL